MTLEAACAKAPASIGNVAVGFDMMGQAFGVAYDQVTARRSGDNAADGRAISLGRVQGLVTRLPEEPARNTALRAGLAVLERADAPFSVTLDVDKGVPMSAGMGGSAASAVAAALAVNALLPRPLDEMALLDCALEGEAASADPPPLDNVVASLLGGLCLIHGPHDIVRLPLPADLVCLLIHPDLKVETRTARDILRPDVPLATAVTHARNAAAFVAACHSGSLDLVSKSMADCLVEPQRAHLVPFLGEAQKRAKAAGALGCSLSGSGPSVFAWARESDGDGVEAALRGAVEAAGLGYRFYRAPLACEGAHMVPADTVAIAGI